MENFQQFLTVLAVLIANWSKAENVQCRWVQAENRAVISCIINNPEQKLPASGKFEKEFKF